jgi:hypothetical protein
MFCTFKELSIAFHLPFTAAAILESSSFAKRQNSRKQNGALNYCVKILLSCTSMSPLSFKFSHAAIVDNVFFLSQAIMAVTYLRM